MKRAAAPISRPGAARQADQSQPQSSSAAATLAAPVTASYYGAAAAAAADDGDEYDVMMPSAAASGPLSSSAAAGSSYEYAGLSSRPAGGPSVGGYGGLGGYGYGGASASKRARGAGGSAYEEDATGEEAGEEEFPEAAPSASSSYIYGASSAALGSSSAAAAGSSSGRNDARRKGVGRGQQASAAEHSGSSSSSSAAAAGASSSSSSSSSSALVLAEANPARPIAITKHGMRQFVETHGGLRMFLQNCVCTVDLKCKPNLETIATRARNAEYNPQRFGAVVMRLRDPKATGLLFSSGKLVVTGTKNEDDGRLAARKIAKIVSKLGFACSFSDFRVQNMVATGDCGFPVRLEGMAHDHVSFSSYEPELFPGLIYRMESPKVVCLVFVSGKVVLTGAKARASIVEGMEKLYPLVYGYRKLSRAPAGPPAASAPSAPFAFSSAAMPAGAAAAAAPSSMMAAQHEEEDASYEYGVGAQLMSGSL